MDITDEKDYSISSLSHRSQHENICSSSLDLDIFDDHRSSLPESKPSLHHHHHQQQQPSNVHVQRSISLPSMDGRFRCTICQQIFDDKTGLNDHVHLVHRHGQSVARNGPKPLACATCGKCFANSSYLSQHARIHLGVKPYRCQLCDRRFTQLCHLQQHIRTHTGEKPYRCRHDGCAKAFSQLSNLQSHTRSHMADRPYRCNSCYKCFADEAGLQEHIPRHTATKHLKTKICNVCGKSYAQETYLARHMAKHETVVVAGGNGDVPLPRQLFLGQPLPRQSFPAALPLSRQRSVEAATLIGSNNESRWSGETYSSGSVSYGLLNNLEQTAQSLLAPSFASIDSFVHSSVGHSSASKLANVTDLDGLFGRGSANLPDFRRLSSAAPGGVSSFLYDFPLT